MGIGRRIKEARNGLGLTQEELAARLGITKGAVANYENETSHPKEPIMYKMIEVLKVDANFLFQDMVKFSDRQRNVALAEYELIEKYRTLDTHGKDVVDFLLEKECERCQSLGFKLRKESCEVAEEIESEFKIKCAPKT